MRYFLLTGIVLIALGTFVLYPGLSYTSERSVMEIGDFHATVEERHVVPAWLGVCAVGAGILLIITGMRRRRPPGRPGRTGDIAIPSGD